MTPTSVRRNASLGEVSIADEDRSAPQQFQRAENAWGPAPLWFRHRRKLGDVIYSLPVIRYLGGGILYLDPASHDGASDQEYWKAQFAQLIPFLRQQPYLREVHLYDGEAFDIDLDAYLHTSHGTPGDRVTIAANHFLGLGLEPPKEIPPWLVATHQPTIYPIVIHRSARYHGNVDYSFLQDVAEELYCVGSHEERRPFEMLGAKAVLTDDVRMLAAVIQSCSVFIGNQSLPLALATGLGQRRMIELSTQLPNGAYGYEGEFVMTDSAAENLAGLRALQEQASRTDRIPIPRRSSLQALPVHLNS